MSRSKKDLAESGTGVSTMLKCSASKYTANESRRKLDMTFIKKWYEVEVFEKKIKLPVMFSIIGDIV